MTESNNNVLTAEAITALLAQTRNRGGHERFVRAFVASGEMYRVVSDAPEYSERCKKDIQIVRNTLAQVAKKHELSNVRLVKADDSTLLIVNTEQLSNE